MHNSWFVALEGAGFSLDTIAADSAPAPQSTNFLIITAEVSWPTNQLSSGPPEVSSEDIPSVSICPEVSSGKQSFSSSVSTNFSEHSISPEVEVSSTITADVGSVFVVSSELQQKSLIRYQLLLERGSKIWIVYLVRLLSALLNPEARSRGGRSSISSALSRR